MRKGCSRYYRGISGPDSQIGNNIKPDVDATSGFILYISFLLEVEISVSVVVRDVLDHLVDEFHLALRKFSVLEILSEKITENSAEILVARI